MFQEAENQQKKNKEKLREWEKMIMLYCVTLSLLDYHLFLMVLAKRETGVHGNILIKTHLKSELNAWRNFLHDPSGHKRMNSRNK